MNLLSIILQANAQPEMPLVEEPTELTLSYLELAQKGGWIMIPLLLLSLVAVYIFVERFLAIRKAAAIDESFMEKIKGFIYEEKLKEAIALCEVEEGPVPRMIEKGLQRIGRPLSDVNTAIENSGKLEIYKLEKGLPMLATVAGGAPMIGFLGTVMGMIRAFYDMAVAGAGNVDVQLLSNGIYTALVTTVAGLIVGIIAYFAYNSLTANVEKVVFNLEVTIEGFMDLLNEPVKK